MGTRYELSAKCAVTYEEQTMSINDGMPPQPKTVQLPAVPEWAIELSRAVKDGFEKQNTTLLDFGERLVRVEIRQKDLEEVRIADNVKNSMRVKQPSLHDLETQAALAGEIAARQELAKDVLVIKADTAAQTVMLTTLTASAAKVFGNPLVRAIATMIGAFVLTWLAAHQGNPPPMPHLPTQQVAP